MRKTRAKKCAGIVLIASPIIIWLAYGVHEFGWLIPTFICAAIAAIICGILMAFSE